MSFNPAGGNISAANDVALSSPANDQVLTYNGTTAKWTNKVLPASTPDNMSVIYSGGTYPTQAGSPPSGLKVRHFYGPTPYAGASWSGVLDLYTYADLT